VCGRYHQHKPIDALALMFEVGEALDEAASFTPRWNIAPTQHAPVVRARADGRRTLSMMRWGLVPPWALDLSGGARCINARAETAPIKPSFRDAVKKRRCLVPATGWYEWRRDGTRKQAFTFEPAEEAFFAFGGLWSIWRPRAEDGTFGEPVETFTVLTVDANASAAAVHDRMPLVLPREAWARWLDPEFTDVDALGGDVRSCPVEWIRLRPLSDKVNNVRHEGPDLLLDVPEAETA
jgi:putative SOS response-associated peptidase YedK